MLTRAAWTRRRRRRLPPTTPNCSTSVTAPDAFVAKINPAASAGAQLLYSSYLGGTGNDVGYGIAVDSGLSAYITGSTSSTDFTIPSGTTPFQRCLDNPANPSPCPTGVTASDAFVGKFGTPCTGSTCTTTTVPFTYFSYLGGSGTDVGLGIAVDSLQGARIAGWTNSATFRLPTIPFRRLERSRWTHLCRALIPRRASTDLSGPLRHLSGWRRQRFRHQHRYRLRRATAMLWARLPRQLSHDRERHPAQSQRRLSDAFLTKLGPTLSLALTETVAPSPVGVGNNVTFTYTITNNGDLTTGIIFTDVIPSTATFVSANSSPGQSSCPAPVTSSTVTCTVGTLNGGAIATVTVVLAPTLPATPAQPGSLSDGGKVSIFGTSTVVTPAPPPAVAVVNNFGIAVSPPTATVAAGIPASFTVTVTPTGNIPDTVTLSASGAPTGGTNDISQRRIVYQPEQRSRKAASWWSTPRRA